MSQQIEEQEKQNKLWAFFYTLGTSLSVVTLVLGVTVAISCATHSPRSVLWVTLASLFFGLSLASTLAYTFIERNMPSQVIQKIEPLTDNDNNSEGEKDFFDYNRPKIFRYGQIE